MATEIDHSWQDEFEAELRTAESARASGNEGMARVCARRAAGTAVRAYFSRRQIPYTGASAYEHLRQLIERADTPSATAELAGRFLLRVTPEHKLPLEADLISDARRLKNELLSLV